MSGAAPLLLASTAPPLKRRGPSEDGGTAIEPVNLKEVTSPRYAKARHPPAYSRAAHLPSLDRRVREAGDAGEAIKPEMQSLNPCSARCFMRTHLASEP